MFALQEGRDGTDVVGFTRGYVRRGARPLVEQLFLWSLANCDVLGLEPCIRYWLLVFPFCVADSFD